MTGQAQRPDIDELRAWLTEQLDTALTLGSLHTCRDDSNDDDGGRAAGGAAAADDGCWVCVAGHRLRLFACHRGITPGAA